MENLTTQPLELSLGQKFTGKLLIDSDKILLVDKSGANFLPPAHVHVVNSLKKVVSGDVVMIEAISNGFEVWKFTPEEIVEWEKLETI